MRRILFPTSDRSPHEAPLRETRALWSDLEKNIQGVRKIENASVKIMAESERFELSVQFSPYTRFPVALLQPLGQLSNA